MSLGIRELHAFVKGPLLEAVAREYKNYSFLSEADLQAYIWFRLRTFLEERPDSKSFSVHCQPAIYVGMKQPIHPDIVLFKNGSPWVIFELKESRKRVRHEKAKKERERLLLCKEHHNARRGYLIYVSRYRRGDGHKKALPGPKGDDGKNFMFEYGVVLEELIHTTKLSDWEKTFRKRAKTMLTAK